MHQYTHRTQYTYIAGHREYQCQWGKPGHKYYNQHNPPDLTNYDRLTCYGYLADHHVPYRKSPKMYPYPP